MEPISLGIFLAGSAAAVLTMLSALANRVRNEKYVHDLTVETRRLRAAYITRLQQLAEDVFIAEPAGTLGQVDVLD